MKTPSVKVCGAYKLHVSPELFAQAMKWKFEGLDVDRKTAEGHVQRELDRTVLLDVRIENCDSRFRIDDFGQSGSEQAPYREVFLNDDGTAIAPELAGPTTGQIVRVAFYLHYFDPRYPLNTSYGPVPVPPVKRMPSHLLEFAPYEPVT